MSRSCRIRFLPLTPTTEQSSFALCRQGCRNTEGRGAVALQILTEPMSTWGEQVMPTKLFFALHSPGFSDLPMALHITNVINTTTSHSTHIMCQNELLIPEALLFECRSLIEID